MINMVISCRVPKVFVQMRHINEAVVGYATLQTMGPTFPPIDENVTAAAGKDGGKDSEPDVGFAAQGASDCQEECSAEINCQKDCPAGRCTKKILRGLKRKRRHKYLVMYQIPQLLIIWIGK